MAAKIKPSELAHYFKTALKLLPRTDTCMAFKMPSILTA
jgi:hypothetical protein